MTQKFTINIPYMIHPFPCHINRFIVMCRLQPSYINTTNNKLRVFIKRIIGEKTRKYYLSHVVRVRVRHFSGDVQSKVISDEKLKRWWASNDWSVQVDHTRACRHARTHARTLFWRFINYVVTSHELVANHRRLSNSSDVSRMTSRSARWHVGVIPHTHAYRH